MLKKRNGSKKNKPSFTVNLLYRFTMGQKIEITETVLRDAHQSLLATRMRTEDMLPIAAKLDNVGYWSLETWGEQSFTVACGILREAPGSGLESWARRCPK